MTPRYIPFLFLHDHHDSMRPHRGLTVRDGTALNEMIGAVSDLGYRYGGQVFNHPAARDSKRDDSGSLQAPTVLHKVPLQATPGNLALTVTRFVTHPEFESDDKRGSRRAGTDLELLLAEHWKKYFTRLTRTVIQLAPALHGELRSGFEDRKDIVFYQSMRSGSDDANEAEASLYRRLSRKAYRGEPRTAAFLLRLEELWPGGPGYLGIFGMTGATTAPWARMLRTRLPHLLVEPGFVMAELSPGNIPIRTSSLEYSDGWGVEVILRARL